MVFYLFLGYADSAVFFTVESDVDKIAIGTQELEPGGRTEFDSKHII